MEEQNTNQANRDMPENSTSTNQGATQQTAPMEANTGGDRPRKSHGALIGSIVIIIILIIGGIYLFKDQAEDLRENENTEEGAMMESEVPGADVEMSSSDELDDIESDLDATSNMELDAGLE